MLHRNWYVSWSGPLALSVYAACSSAEAFECEEASQCAVAGVEGFCEANRRCSHADASCASGRRYGVAGGDVAMFCVGDEPVAGCATAITTGERHACAVREDGSVWCWGANHAGQLGDGTLESRRAPVSVVDDRGEPLSGVTEVAAGRSHTCARFDTGAVACWGKNDLGQLGLGEQNTSDRLHPKLVPRLSTAVAIAAGANHTCALIADGRVLCWGDNREGQLGTGSPPSTCSGTLTVRRSPTEVLVPGDCYNPVPFTMVAQISLGGNRTCALRSGGTLWCWGKGAGSRFPVQMRFDDMPVFGSFASTSGEHRCVVARDGGVRCWGSNDFGQLGTGDTSARTSPAPVIASIARDQLGGVRELSAGATHTCAVGGDDRLSCWGSNQAGELGFASPDHSAIATLVPGLAGVADVRAGVGFSCIRRRDEHVYCMGDDQHGQLGQGDPPAPGPVRILLPCEAGE